MTKLTSKFPLDWFGDPVITIRLVDPEELETLLSDPFTFTLDVGPDTRYYRPLRANGKWVLSELTADEIDQLGLTGGTEDERQEPE